MRNGISCLSCECQKGGKKVLEFKNSTQKSEKVFFAPRHPASVFFALIWKKTWPGLTGWNHVAKGVYFRLKPRRFVAVTCTCRAVETGRLTEADISIAWAQKWTNWVFFWKLVWSITTSPDPTTVWTATLHPGLSPCSFYLFLSQIWNRQCAAGSSSGRCESGSFSTPADSEAPTLKLRGWRGGGGGFCRRWQMWGKKKQENRLLRTTESCRFLDEKLEHVIH